MAVDKKSDHVGNHGGAYTDNDGMRKQFTIIDHDKKLKISSHVSSETLEDIQKLLDQYLKEKIETVLLLPAMNIYDASGGIYNNLLNISQDRVTWNEEAVKAHCTANINSFITTLLWRRTVAMAHWFHPKWQEGDMDWLRSREWETLIP